LKSAAVGAACGRRRFGRESSAGRTAACAGAFGGGIYAEKVAAPQRIEALTTDRPRLGFMLEVINRWGSSIFCANPGSSVRCLHESVVNYGGNSKPEFITCLHEESSVSKAHGLRQIEGQPLMILAPRHRRVAACIDGHLQRLLRSRPVYVVLGNIRNANFRRASAEWYHSVQDAAAMGAITSSGTTRPRRWNILRKPPCALTRLRWTPPTEPVGPGRGRGVAGSVPYPATQSCTFPVDMTAPPRAIQVRWRRLPGCWWAREPADCRGRAVRTAEGSGCWWN